MLIIVCVAAIVATAAAGAVTGTRTRDPEAPTVLGAENGRRSAALGQTISRTTAYRDGP
ncbi:hypothetical protein HMPREF1550_00533 [Actinomyces sp. oral taxon 877 str. F0543]|nr:hypothetical protein HMPREF1550_00533 [Actinomyces sp. oral taxon 877 str. F0543]